MCRQGRLIASLRGRFKWRQGLGNSDSLSFQAVTSLFLLFLMVFVGVRAVQVLLKTETGQVPVIFSGAAARAFHRSALDQGVELDRFT